MGEYKSKNLIDLKKQQRKERLTNLVFVILVVVLVGVFIYLRTNVFMVVSVKGNSMCNTLNNDDLLFAVKTSRVTRGDIVVIYDEDINKEALIKRVIGIEGDTLWSEDGYVYISYTDGSGNEVKKKLEENYLLAYGVTTIHAPITIPQGCVYVLGDNREVSSDSRIFGAVAVDSVIGVVPDWSVSIKDGKFVSWYKKVIQAQNF